MLIPFMNIAGRNVAKAEVEIPDQVLNHFAVSFTEKESILNIPHVRSGSFTRIMGDAALRFDEPEHKLSIPDKEYKGIHVAFPNINIQELLIKLGFQKKGPVSYWHPAFIHNDSDHCIEFDINSDTSIELIRKIFNLGLHWGFRMGQK